MAIQKKGSQIGTTDDKISKIFPPEGSQLGAKQGDYKDSKMISTEGDDFFTSYNEVYGSIDTANLRERLLTSLSAYGINKPSELERGILPFSQGLDVVEIAESDQRKTIFICSGILHQLNYALLECQCLILAPTLELVQKLARAMHELGQFLGVKVHVCGSEDLNTPQKNLGVVVGTPDSVLDMLETKLLDSKHIKLLVLDGADLMSLYCGIKHQIYKIFKLLPIKVQVGVFSESMPPEVIEIARELMVKPVKVVGKLPELALEGIQHFIVTCGDEEMKVDMIRDLYPRLVDTHCVVFVDTEKSLALLAKEMGERGYKIFIYKEREVEGLQKFCRESSGVLITKDILPCDDFVFQAPSVLVNYDLPSYPKDYVSRQFGRVVDIYNFLTMYDWPRLLVCQRLYKFSLVPFDWSTLKPMVISSSGADSQLSSAQDDLEMSDMLADNGDDGFPSYDEVYERFDDMKIKLELRVRLCEYGFRNPSEVQRRVLVPLCDGLNVLVQTESEPGKIVTFCSAIVQRWTRIAECQCIVLAQEIGRVKEITKVLRYLSAHLLFVKVYACGEGVESVYDDLRYYDDGVVRKKYFHVVVGTPNRVLNMLKSKNISPDHINLVVLDEAEFTAFRINQIDEISKFLPTAVQIGVFSERLSPVAVKATHVLCSRSERQAPVKIVVKKNQDEATSTPLEGMIHFVVNVESHRERPSLVGSLLGELQNIPQCIVFVDNVYSVGLLLLALEGIPNVRAWAVRSDMDQTYRDMVMRDFGAGSINVLITTYRMVPGFDIRGLLVINYDMTSTLSMDVYRKRIARFGTTGGVVVNIVDEDSWWNMLTLHEESGVHFEDLPHNFADVLYWASTHFASSL